MSTILTLKFATHFSLNVRKNVRVKNITKEENVLLNNAFVRKEYYKSKSNK